MKMSRLGPQKPATCTARGLQDRGDGDGKATRCKVPGSLCHHAEVSHSLIHTTYLYLWLLLCWVILGPRVQEVSSVPVYRGGQLVFTGEGRALDKGVRGDPAAQMTSGQRSGGNGRIRPGLAGRPRSEQRRKSPGGRGMPGTRKREEAGALAQESRRRGRRGDGSREAWQVRLGLQL